MVKRYFKDGWAVQITKDPTTGCKYEFQQQFTLSGAAQNLDLNIPFPIKVHRIEYFSNDATAKSFIEQIFSGGVDNTSYDAVVNLVADINLPNAFAGSEDNVYTQSPIIVRTAISASTAGKLLTKKVIVTRVE